MSENPRPRPSRGVMGYVAELQQFDPVPPYIDELHPAEPAALVPSPPPVTPAPIVSHIRQQPRRRTQTAILAAAAVAILAGAGLGYAALGGSADAPRTRAQGTAPSDVPTDGLPPLDPALPGSEPVAARTTGPTATSNTTAATTTGTSETDRPLPDAVTLPGVPDPWNPPPAATAAPTEPAATQPAVAPPLPLIATISHVVDPAEDGLLGYAGTVRIENPGSRDVTGWRVTLTVPGGNAVTATGASVAQDGETVTFTPDGEPTVPAGGAVTFSFQVAGLLSALPGACAIDGSPCS
ncbi:cellulose binding domain-containing protein [Actinoplanes sp. CA-051413]|uniref:cellulose binding domain-containing protein n=1 Tax=Actinoplanes sp. CA-051413 TaxID=3239899 RepID=UPI003D95F5FE